MTDEQRKKANTERTAANMRRQQKAKEERKKAKARQELNAINNIVAAQSATATKKESAQKERIRKSENAKWKQKRYERYQKRVWPGWRTSERPGKIVKYNINDVSQNKEDEETQ
ncbi:hypothetical protein P4K96_27580 [Bacillus cereus]|uniref:hypothetical protein n=1 Tax=Paenibacillus melissococcoides TaxID=2912268 RepID=UPI0021C2E093|nr:hypothetical protein [Paenibacillus melissococcoides]MEB9897181.1 hypothetical protein [Bacillus cereus]CAH8721283.1 hypothetical protein HTL2_006281 [Paenibacillus melissococcoides]